MGHKKRSARRESLFVQTSFSFISFVAFIAFIAFLFFFLFL